MTWVLRWDTAAEPEPRLEGAAFADNIFLDGYLFDGGTPDLDPDRLRGAFALLRWDPARRTLTVARDAMGLQPCYYRWDGRTLAVSSTIDAIADRGRFNARVVADYVSVQMTDAMVRETFYEDVRRVPPAHVLTVGERTIAERRYWNPLPSDFAWATKEELRQFAPIFDRAVARTLEAGADSIALSGGFDSISIAVTAARQGRALHAVSLRFAHTTCDEGDSQAEVARALGMPQTLRTMHDALDGANCIDASLALSGSSPCPVLGMWQSLYTALIRAARSPRRMLFGTGGDDVFGVDLAYGLDRARRLDAPGLWRFYRSCQRASPFPAARVARLVLWVRAIRPALGLLVHAAVGQRRSRELRRRALRRGLPGWISREAAEAMLERRLDAGPELPAPSDPAYARSLRRLTQSPILILENEQAWEWGRATGWTRLYPYFDRDLVSLALRMHPEHLIAGGKSKAPIRALVAARLPHVKLRSKKVDFTEMAHGDLRPAGPGAWRRLGGPRALAQLGIVDPGRINAAMDSYFEGRNNEAVRTWMVLSTEAWLQAHS